ncbi:MAG: class I SAM-dependent methyltransferase, partial [Candidatus Altiarchaeota archaeon]|nr:class I SAM-dependent methyltransferase [Candidatus Altiarchaeota archaeon]
NKKQQKKLVDILNQLKQKTDVDELKQLREDIVYENNKYLINIKKITGELESKIEENKLNLSNKADLKELMCIQETLEAKANTKELVDIRSEIEHSLEENVVNVLTKRAELEEEEEKRLLNSLYVSFEDRFRGSREDIALRGEVYIPYIKNAGVGKSKSPIVDIGCGRGEWLELLKSRGFVASGVDLNEVMVSESKKRGLDVEEMDALEYLKKQKNNSVGAVTGFHIVEHLPLSYLIRLFDECLRVLKKGGLVIFETPNPENIIIGASNFYTDPTHRNPIPSWTLAFLLENRGLKVNEIVKQKKDKVNMEDNVLEDMFNTYFNTSADYAVVASKE